MPINSEPPDDVIPCPKVTPVYCDFFRTHADVGIIGGTADSLIWIGLTR